MKVAAFKITNWPFPAGRYSTGVLLIYCIFIESNSNKDEKFSIFIDSFNLMLV